jgi:hypothetical protein
MFDIRILEALCRSLPEITTGIVFFVRRKSVDTRLAYSVLDELGVDEQRIQEQRPLINELADFEGLKKDWDGAFLMCFLSYLVLAFTASTVVLFSGMGVWVVVFVLVRLKLNDEKPGSRFRSRRFMMIAVFLVLIASISGKVATVFWQHK